jgi:FMN phosphatase YigB (HAD superfamily)
MDRLALFDLDDTLVDLGAAFDLFAAEFADRYGLDADARGWLATAGRSGYLPRPELFGEARKRFGLPDPVEEMLSAYRRRMPDLVMCRPEVLAGLSMLRAAGWRVGIVTNGDEDNQQGKIDRTGLGKLADAVCVSGALDIRKPDPRIFQIAAERAGCVLGAGGWMVGDNPTADVGGGAGVGLRTVWIRKAGDRLDPGVPAPDHTVGDVLDAIALLLRGAGP